MTNYKALADRLESYRPQELGRAEQFGIDLAQAAAILRQLASVDVEGAMKCAMGWVSAPFSHQRREALDDALRALAVRVCENIEAEADVVQQITGSTHTDGVRCGAASCITVIKEAL